MVVVDGLVMQNTTSTSPPLTVPFPHLSFQLFTFCVDFFVLALYSPSDRTGLILVWNTQDFSLSYSLDAHQGVVHGLSFSDEGRHLVSVCNDATMRIWSTHAEDYDEMQTVWDRAHVSSLTAVAYYNKAKSRSKNVHQLKFIASGSSSGKVSVGQFTQGLCFFFGNFVVVVVARYVISVVWSINSSVFLCVVVTIVCDRDDDNIGGGEVLIYLM